MTALLVAGWYLAGYIAAGHFYGHNPDRGLFWTMVACGYGSLILMLCLPHVRQADRKYPWQSTRWIR